MSSDEEKKPLRRVERLLDKLFAQGGPPSGEPVSPGEGGEPQLPPAGQDPGSAEKRAVPMEARAPAAPSSPQRLVRLLLTVDDGGEYIVCAGDAVLLGHSRGGRADLPVLADVGVEHARFVRRMSLAGGEEWRMEPVGSERVFRNAEPISTSCPLADGDELTLGGNLELRFRMPDPASSTAVIDFLHGVECLGAGHAILLAGGTGGRLRVGAAAGRHIRVPNLLTGVEFRWVSDRLELRSEVGVAAGGERNSELVLPFPPPQRVDLTIGAGEGTRPPFGLSLTPIPAETPPPEGGAR